MTSCSGCGPGGFAAASRAWDLGMKVKRASVILTSSFKLRLEVRMFTCRCASLSASGSVARLYGMEHWRARLCGSFREEAKALRNCY